MKLYRYTIILNVRGVRGVRGIYIHYYEKKNVLHKLNKIFLKIAVLGHDQPLTPYTPYI